MTHKPSSNAQSLLKAAVADVYATICRLRAPDGCPWDREQTPESLRASVLEEAHEVVEAIDSGDTTAVQEELGDLLLLVLMIARIYEERGDFSTDTIAQVLNEKLIRRHPHVFGSASVAGSADVVSQWERIKIEVEGKPEKAGTLDGVSPSLPALDRAFQLQKKAAKVGFDWPDHSGVRQKLHEEIDELCDLLEAEPAEASGSTKNHTPEERIEDEVGDVLFSVVNLARTHKINPSLALGRTNRKFLRRFRFVEEQMAASSLELSREHLEQMEAYWQEAKKDEL